MKTPAFSVCVYCGSKPGADPSYAALATEVGHWIGSHGDSWSMVAGATA